ncbi:MAG: SAM-dependent methyltransferase [Chloroflexi bacterium]|nr:SAM-dependent methyltransferase [Chloroflexota bacterium]
MDDVQQELVALIQQERRISFARFMELALFSPRGGYYSSPEGIGAHGDYFTSPLAHPVFGALLSLQLEQMWRLLGSPPTFTAVEPGAGNGLLAQAIVEYSQHLAPDFSHALRYVALDRYPVSPDLAWPSRPPASRLVAQGIPLRGVVGCVLTNELLDSFPVHRFKVQGGRILEVFVTLQGDRFVETLAEPSTPTLEAYLHGPGFTLPDGFQGEVNLALDPWMQEVAAALERGFVLTIDYGALAPELYSAARTGGTLRCYYKHTLSGNPYVRVGQQDITAHVDFSAPMELGARCGLECLGYTTQREFLLNLGFEAFLKGLAQKRLPQREYLSNRMGMEELVRPEGLGRFKVLAQGKRVDVARLNGFHPENPLHQELLGRSDTLPVPLLTQEYTPLLEGRYPHLAFDPQELWPWGPREGKPLGG